MWGSPLLHTHPDDRAVATATLRLVEAVERWDKLRSVDNEERMVAAARELRMAEARRARGERRIPVGVG